MGQTDPAVIRLIQNIHRQSLVYEKPAIMGLTKGPIFEVKPKTSQLYLYTANSDTGRCTYRLSRSAALKLRIRQGT